MKYDAIRADLQTHLLVTRHTIEFSGGFLVLHLDHMDPRNFTPDNLQLRTLPEADFADLGAHWACLSGH